MRKFMFLILMTSVFLPATSFASVYTVDIGQDADVISGKQWVGENQSNQGVNPEIEPIRASDGYNTRHNVYLGFNLLSNDNLKNAISQGDKIDGYKLYAYNVRNFAMGDANISDVITNIHYVNNDNWWEGPYGNWTVINSSNPMDGITYNNQVGYNEYLASENENAVNKWYSWEFTADAFSLSGANDSLNYLSLAMVPNSLNRTSAWWLVSSFASKENQSYPHPYLEVYTTPAVPEPATMLLLPLGLAGFRLLKRRKA